MSTLTSYNGLEVVTPSPLPGAGGAAINNNFIALSTKIATSDPTTGDDSTMGYSKGSRWYNSSTTAEWVCTDPTASAAVWIPIASGAYLALAGGTMTGDLNLGNNKVVNASSVAVNTATPSAAMQVVDTVANPPATSGSAAFSGLRVGGGSVYAEGMDLGIQGTSGPYYTWIQSRNVTDYSVNYGLQLNPNGGYVSINGASAGSPWALTCNGNMFTGGEIYAYLYLQSTASQNLFFQSLFTQYPTVTTATIAVRAAPSPLGNLTEWQDSSSTVMASMSGTGVMSANAYVGWGIVPVGTITAWLLSFSGTPSLPDGWVQCNGQVLSDSASVYNGATLPNLNGASSSIQRFLRGSTTSGATGGSETHSHSFSTSISTATVQSGSGASGVSSSLVSGTTSGASTLPSYYEVVYIMRIK